MTDSLPSMYEQEREWNAHNCPECAKPCPSFDMGAKAERDRIVESIRKDAGKHLIDAKTLDRFGLAGHLSLLADILRTIADAVEDGSL